MSLYFLLNLPSDETIDISAFRRRKSRFDSMVSQISKRLATLEQIGRWGLPTCGILKGTGRFILIILV